MSKANLDKTSNLKRTMIRILRHIRQRLLHEGKMSRYIGYALGEVFLIVIGILIALQISNWNQDRMDRREEVIILNRIINELDRCIDEVTIWSDVVKEKEQALYKLREFLDGEPIPDPLHFIQYIPRGADMGWTQPNFARSTYLELVGSGKMGLINNIKLRENINDYYEELAEWHKRGSARVSPEFTNIIFSIIPFNRDVEKDVNSLDLNVAAENPEALVEAILNSDLDQYLVYEINRAGFLWIMFQKTLTDAIELKNQIEAYLAL